MSAGESAYGDIASALPADAQTQTARDLRLEFRGDAREYFRIWVVNLCLTLLTLGIFSAWAKVRKKRYFYSHTTLDGTPFQYLAQPLPIFKGRVVAAALFVTYYFASNFFTAILPYVLALGAVLAPWVLVRSAEFNARYSAFRNINFQFHAGYREALLTIYAWGLIPLLIVGTIFQWWGDFRYAAGAFGLFALFFPWWIKRLKTFLVNHTYYGGEPGELQVRGRDFWKIYFIAGLVVSLVAIVAGFLTGFVFSSLKNTAVGVVLFMLPLYAGYVAAFAYSQARTTNLVWNNSTLGPLSFRSSLRGRDLALLYTVNALAIGASLGLLIPWAVIRTFKYRADHMNVVIDGSLTAFHGEEQSAVAATGGEVGEFFDMDLSL